MVIAVKVTTIEEISFEELTDEMQEEIATAIIKESRLSVFADRFYIDHEWTTEGTAVNIVALVKEHCDDIKAGDTEEIEWLRTTIDAFKKSVAVMENRLAEVGVKTT